MTKTLAVAAFVVAGFMAVSVTGLAAQPQSARQQPVAAAQPAQPGSSPRGAASSTQPPSSQPPSTQPSSSQTASSQPPSQPAGSLAATSAKAPPKLETVIGQIQKATLSMNANIARLRIEKWRTDADQKEQLQKLASSLQRNVTYAVPGLISDVQNSRGSVSSAFKLYHDVNVVYEYLSSLADAAGSLGRKEEYDPLAEDAAALDSAREGLSSYIEQTALVLETPPKPSPNAVSSAEGESAGGGRKIIVEEVSGKPAKPTKKKTSTSPAKPAATPAPGKHGAASGKANPPSATGKPSAASASGKPSPASASLKASPPAAGAKTASAKPASTKTASVKPASTKTTAATASAAVPTPAPK
ncbi:MAG: hypothetical protein LAO20_08500 [Acidobacteriia bacterium]|nr:hypothetical protein [Terriglobia bacterium]